MSKPNVSELSKKEKKEFLKKYRLSAEKKSRLQGNLVKVAVGLVLLLVVGALGYLLFGPKPPQKEVGQVIPQLSQQHIAQGTKSPIRYNSNPPTSGPHWPTPAPCQIYTQEIPDESALHSMEHGAIWISYKNKNNKDLINNLTNLANKDPIKILLSPRSKDDSNIAIAAWGHLLKLSNFDGNLIQEFIKLYRSRSPEPFGSC